MSEKKSYTLFRGNNNKFYVIPEDVLDSCEVKAEDLKKYKLELNGVQLEIDDENPNSQVINSNGGGGMHQKTCFLG